MSLPPLPPSEWPAVRLGLSPGVMAYTAEQMREYGQQCRDQALEEAAVGLETGDVSGLKDDAYMRSYTTHLLVSFAKHFRSLK